MQPDVLVTTRQAAHILAVHESSVKRWCNDGLLPAQLTAGSHRRLKFSDVIAFARSEKIDYPLSPFSPHEQDVWMAIQDALKGNYEEVRSLLYDATNANRESFVQQLVTTLMKMGAPIGSVFDNVLGPVVRTMTDDWVAGVIAKGDSRRMTQLLADCIACVRSRIPTIANRPLALVACSPGNETELGALMLRATLEQSGWRTVYPGPDLSIDDLAIQQSRWNARVVCMSLQDSETDHDVTSIVDALTQGFNPDRPYHLVLGGSSESVDNADVVDHPFLGLERFSSIHAFGQWAVDKAKALK